MIQRFNKHESGKILCILSILSMGSAEQLRATDQDKSAWDSIISALEITLGNRILIQKEQQRAHEKIEIEPISKNYFLKAKERVKNVPDLKNRVVRLFNALDTIDNNINYYLNDPTNIKFKNLLNGALSNCFKIKNEILNVVGQARIDNNEDLRDMANKFYNLAEKIYGTTQALMENVQPVVAPKKSKNIFKRILSK